VRISHSQLHSWDGGALRLAPCEPCVGPRFVAPLLIHARVCWCRRMLTISESPLTPSSRWMLDEEEHLCDGFWTGASNSCGDAPPDFVTRAKRQLSSIDHLLVVPSGRHRSVAPTMASRSPIREPNAVLRAAVGLSMSMASLKHVAGVSESPCSSRAWQDAMQS
jgi:hypothetical protein